MVRRFFISVFLLLQLPFAAHAEKIGIFSGTFDPPHIGHARLVTELKDRYQLDVVYVIPNVESSHKPGATSYAHRKEMCRLTFENIEGVMLADESLERSFMSGGRAAVWNEIRQRHPTGEHFMLLGDDAMARVLMADESQFSNHLRLIVLPRDGGYLTWDSLIELAETLQDPTLAKKRLLHLAEKGFLHMPHVMALLVSSTLVRNQIRSGTKPKEINEAVYQYILQQELYSIDGCSGGLGLLAS